MSEIHPFISNKWRSNIPPPLPPLIKWFFNDESFGYLPSNDTESIFLGTFPTYEVVNGFRVGGNKEFFYGSTDNSFWPLLGNISALPALSEQQIFDLLDEVNFGIIDILKKIERQGQSASDAALTPLVFNKVIDLKSNFLKLKNIYATSGGKGKITKGTRVTAAKWLRDSLINAGYTVVGFNVEGFQKRIKVFDSGQLIWEFNLNILWSPSPTGNIPTQGFINRNLEFADLLPVLPAAYAELPVTVKARLVQWAYLLQLHGFPLEPALDAFITDNLPLLSILFA